MGRQSAARRKNFKVRHPQKKEAKGRNPCLLLSDCYPSLTVIRCRGTHQEVHAEAATHLSDMRPCGSATSTETSRIAVRCVQQALNSIIATPRASQPNIAAVDHVDYGPGGPAPSAFASAAPSQYTIALNFAHLCTHACSVPSNVSCSYSPTRRPCSSDIVHPYYYQTAP